MTDQPNMQGNIDADKTAAAKAKAEAARVEAARAAKQTSDEAARVKEKADRDARGVQPR